MASAAIAAYPPHRMRRPADVVRSTKQRADDPLMDIADGVKEVMRLTNEIRRKKGLRKLAWSNNLHRACEFHANDMAKKKYLAHNSANGTIWWKRIKKWYKNPAGENIARGFDSPAEVVAAWMNSPLHRKNILNSKFRTIGVGFNGNGDYWVQDFGY